MARYHCDKGSPTVLPAALKVPNNCVIITVEHILTKNIPWIKEFPSDELKIIAAMSLEERGVYYSLKLIYHTSPEVFLSERTLFAACLAFSESEQTAVRTLVERLFKQSSDKFPFNERLNGIEERALIGINQRKLAGKASGKARKKKSTSVERLFEQPEPEPEPEPDSKSNLEPDKKEEGFFNKNNSGSGLGYDITLHLGWGATQDAEYICKAYGKKLEDMIQKYNTDFIGGIQNGKPPDKPDKAFIGWLKNYLNKAA